MRLAALTPVRSWAGRVLKPYAFDLRAVAPDIAIGLALAVVGVVATLIGYDRLSPYIQHYSAWDFWFESDPTRNVEQAANRFADWHHTTSHHPLFSFIIFPPTLALRTVGLSLFDALGVVLAASTAVWLGLSLAVLRLLKVPRIDATVFTVLMGASAAAIFWFPVPETFGFGAITIMLVMLVAAVAERWNVKPGWAFVLAGVAAMSVTTTNVLVALALMFVFLTWRDAIGHAIRSGILVAAAWSLQQIVFPSSMMFINIFTPAEVDYLFNREALGIFPKLWAIFFHSIAMPDIGYAYGSRLSVQHALPGQGSLLTVAAVLVWTALLGLAIWSFIRARRAGERSKAFDVIVLAIAAELAVSIVFGIETFLYTVHIAPLLILFAAFTTRTPQRWIATSLAGVLAVLAGINNVGAFADGAEKLRARHEHERAFTALLAERTEPDSLIVCGGEAMAATGEADRVRPSPSELAVKEINSTFDPDTCAFAFDDLTVSRQGWILWYEDWSEAAIETYVGRGADYFVTSYEYGLETRAELIDALAARYSTVVRTPEWIVLDLRSEPREEAGAQ